MNVKRGNVVLVDLEPVKGSEQGKVRPCIVVQSDFANRYSPTTIVIPLTSTILDKAYPTTVVVHATTESGLRNLSTALCNQPRTVSVKDRIVKIMGLLGADTMRRVGMALKASMQLD